MLGNVKGFHLEGPASQGRGERVCSTLAVGTLGTVQLKKVIWIQVTHQLVTPCSGSSVAKCTWDWNLLRTIFASWGFHQSAMHNETS